MTSYKHEAVSSITASEDGCPPPKCPRISEPQDVSSITASEDGCSPPKCPRMSESDTAQNSPDDSDQEPAEIVVEQPATSEIFSDIARNSPADSDLERSEVVSQQPATSESDTAQNSLDDSGQEPPEIVNQQLAATELDTARNSPDDSDQEPAEIVVEQPATSESDTARNSPDDSGQEATEIVTKQLAMSESDMARNSPDDSGQEPAKIVAEQLATSESDTARNKPDDSDQEPAEIVAEHLASYESDTARNSPDDSGQWVQREMSPFENFAEQPATSESDIARDSPDDSGPERSEVVSQQPATSEGAFKVIPSHNCMGRQHLVAYDKTELKQLLEHEDYILHLNECSHQELEKILEKYDLQGNPTSERKLRILLDVEKRLKFLSHSEDRTKLWEEIGRSVLQSWLEETKEDEQQKEKLLDILRLTWESKDSVWLLGFYLWKTEKVWFPKLIQFLMQQKCPTEFRAERYPQMPEDREQLLAMFRDKCAQWEVRTNFLRCRFENIDAELNNWPQHCEKAVFRVEAASPQCAIIPLEDGDVNRNRESRSGLQDGMRYSRVQFLISTSSQPSASTSSASGSASVPCLASALSATPSNFRIGYLVSKKSNTLSQPSTSTSSASGSASVSRLPSVLAAPPSNLRIRHLINMPSQPSTSTSSASGSASVSCLPSAPPSNSRISYLVPKKSNTSSQPSTSTSSAPGSASVSCLPSVLAATPSSTHPSTSSMSLAYVEPESKQRKTLQAEAEEKDLECRKIELNKAKNELTKVGIELAKETRALVQKMSDKLNEGPGCYLM